MAQIETAEYARASLTPTKDIEAAPWNVNVMSPDKFTVLKADMKEKGPKGVDPIHYCKLGDHQYTIDGAQRLTVAKELGWPVVYTYFHPEITTEEQARLFNYRRDAERGDIDPFRLAASFKWFADQGMKQGDIAQRFGVDASTVSHRLSLLKVEEPVKKELAGLSTSHFEIIAAVPAPVQAEAVGMLKTWSKNYRRPVGATTVEHVQDAVSRAKQSYDKTQALQKALNDPRVKPEFRKCPECKSEPTEVETESWYIWPGAVLVVEDRNYHHWSLATGPKPAEKRSSSRGTSVSSRPPQHEKSRVPTDRYVDATIAFFDSVWPKFDKVSSFEYYGEDIAKAGSRALLVKAKGVANFGVRVEGDYEGKSADLDVSFEENSDASIEFSVGKGPHVSFKFEQNGTSDKTFGTYVRGGYLATRKDLHDLEDAAVLFLEEYGKLPRGNNPDWARIQKRKKAK